MHQYNYDCHLFCDLAFEHGQDSPNARDPADERIIAYDDEDANSDEEEPYIHRARPLEMLPPMPQFREMLADQMWARYQVQPWYMAR